MDKMAGFTIVNEKICEVRVACGSFALAYNGLTFYSWLHPDLMTAYKEIDGVNAVLLSWYYNPEIDYEHWLRAIPESPYILMPSKERAIVEYIKNEKWCDEGVLIEALKTYLEEHRPDELYEVADFFKVERKVIDYWCKEAMEDHEI